MAKMNTLQKRVDQIEHAARQKLLALDWRAGKTQAEIEMVEALAKELNQLLDAGDDAGIDAFCEKYGFTRAKIEAILRR